MSNKAKALLTTLVASLLFFVFTLVWLYFDGESLASSRALLQAVIFGVLWGPAMWWLAWRKDRPHADSSTER